MATLTELLETGRLRIVVDRAFPLAETADALRYLVSGRPVGRVVVTVGDARWMRRPASPVTRLQSWLRQRLAKWLVASSA